MTLQYFLHPSMRQAWNKQAIGAFSSFRSDQSVQDRLLGRIHRGLKERVQGEIGMHFDINGCCVINSGDTFPSPFTDMGVCRREGDEEVA